MASITRFLEKRLRLKVNSDKSMVARPWTRRFLGYSVTFHRQPRLKVSEESVKRLKDALKTEFRQGRGRKLERVIETLHQKLRGWIQYFRLSQTKGIFGELDGWIRRRLRCLLWRQWKRPKTRFRNMMQRGLAESHRDGAKQGARTSASNGRGPWWNAEASQSVFEKPLYAGLVSRRSIMRTIAAQRNASSVSGNTS